MCQLSNARIYILKEIWWTKIKNGRRNERNWNKRGKNDSLNDHRITNDGNWTKKEYERKKIVRKKE